jgi:hypothetical protein
VAVVADEGECAFCGSGGDELRCEVCNAVLTDEEREQGNSRWPPMVATDRGLGQGRRGDPRPLGHPLQTKDPAERPGALSRQTSPIIHPVDAVRGFIDLLVEDGLRTYAKGDYSVPKHHCEALREGAEAIRARAKRSKDIAEKVESILKLADDDELARFRREDWMRKPPSGFSMSPADLIEAGGEEFERLDRALYRLQPLPWQRSIPTDAVGLPVDRHLEREAEMSRIAEEAAEAARQAEAEKVRLNRIDRITAYVQAPEVNWLFIRAMLPSFVTHGVSRSVYFSDGKLPPQTGKNLGQSQMNALGYREVSAEQLAKPQRKTTL